MPPMTPEQRSRAHFNIWRAQTYPASEQTSANRDAHLQKWQSQGQPFSASAAEASSQPAPSPAQPVSAQTQAIQDMKVLRDKRQQTRALEGE